MEMAEALGDGNDGDEDRVKRERCAHTDDDDDDDD